MEDAIALSQALNHHADITDAFAAYEAERKPVVEAQRAAQVSLEWFEDTERFFGRMAPKSLPSVC